MFRDDQKALVEDLTSVQGLSLLASELTDAGEPRLASSVTFLALDLLSPAFQGSGEVRPLTFWCSALGGSRIYTAVVQFRAVSPGNYMVRVRTTASEVIVARSLGETFRGFIVFAAVGSLGGLLIATGVILLIVGSVKRSRMSRQQPVLPQGFTPSAGWYPDLSQVGRQRLWDGTRWTDHYV